MNRLHFQKIFVINHHLGWRNDLPIWLNVQNKYGRVDVVHVHELHHAPDRGKVSDLNSGKYFIFSIFVKIWTKISIGFFHEIQCVDGIGKCIEPPPFKYLDVVALSYANTGIYVTQYTGSIFSFYSLKCKKEENCICIFLMELIKTFIIILQILQIEVKIFESFYLLLKISMHFSLVK